MLIYIYIYANIHTIWLQPQSHQPSYTVSKAPAGVDAWHATLTMTSTSLASQNMAKSDGKFCSSSLGSVYNMFHLQWSSVKQPIFLEAKDFAHCNGHFSLGAAISFFGSASGFELWSIRPPHNETQMVSPKCWEKIMWFWGLKYVEMPKKYPGHPDHPGHIGYGLPKPGRKRPESQALPQRGGIRPQTGRKDGMTKHLFKTSPSEGSTKKKYHDLHSLICRDDHKQVWSILFLNGFGSWWI